MENEILSGILRSLGSEIEIINGKQFPEIIVPASKLYTTAMKLKEDNETKFDFLVCVTGVDYGNELGVVYHLRSTGSGKTVVLKTRTPREEPVIDSVSDLWKSADMLEREVYDLLGIRFNNHPDLRRLFLDSSWGFPLRKDYVDEINIVTR